MAPSIINENAKKYFFSLITAEKSFSIQAPGLGIHNSPMAYSIYRVTKTISIIVREKTERERMYKKMRIDKDW